MIGVYQTRPDNCVAACVASIFEQGIGDIPVFNPVSWFDDLCGWLKTFDWWAINVTIHPGFVVRGLSLGSVTPAYPLKPGWKHCVVCRDNKVIWCPQEGWKSGLLDAEDYTILYPMNIGGSRD